MSKKSRTLSDAGTAQIMPAVVAEEQKQEDPSIADPAEVEAVIDVESEPVVETVEEVVEEPDTPTPPPVPTQQPKKEKKPKVKPEAGKVSEVQKIKNSVGGFRF